MTFILTILFTVLPKQYYCNIFLLWFPQNSWSLQLVEGHLHNKSKTFKIYVDPAYKPARRHKIMLAFHISANHGRYWISTCHTYYWHIHNTCHIMFTFHIFELTFMSRGGGSWSWCDSYRLPSERTAVWDNLLTSVSVKPLDILSEMSGCLTAC